MTRTARMVAVGTLALALLALPSVTAASVTVTVVTPTGTTTRTVTTTTGLDSALHLRSDNLLGALALGGTSTLSRANLDQALADIRLHGTLSTSLAESLGMTASDIALVTALANERSGSSFGGLGSTFTSFGRSCGGFGSPFGSTSSFGTQLGLLDSPFDTNSCGFTEPFDSEGRLSASRCEDIRNTFTQEFADLAC